MTEQIRQIAARVKELREIAGVSLESLARDLGIAAGEYERYESGEADIPVSFLYEIAGRFQVELTSLLAGEEPRLHIYCLVRRGRGLSVERRREYCYEDLAYNFINKKAETFLVTVDPLPAGASEAPLPQYAHPGQELNYLLSGRLEISIAGSRIVMEEGDCLYFDSGHRHGMRALGGKAARFLAVIVPGEETGHEAR